ncbi:hypothetical protein SEVIR_5G069700v4 [Setaria viridis]|uniref:NAC domain-containing protein n=1 Tax=Setaria viridis TaxID=4556 RepID=A0A4U6UCR9_SETVI|nr:NAC domain-containing protein 87-like [Setaria viridis]TKW12962.1 hypothetical protein SEVIR_5G069700v2 [Setaria viridis]
MADQGVLFAHDQGTTGDQHQQPHGIGVGDDLELPPGFRFYPSDEEIVTFYLKPKVEQRSFTCIAIGEVDLKRTEPCELPGKAKTGEKEWYFFYEKDRKYRTGLRMNRATEGGYWKATGKDKEIYRAMTGVLIGMKKTLVFYTGRAPRGQKTTWVMHEYRLEGNNKSPHPSSSSTSTTMKSSSASEATDEWVVCRVFRKATGIKKAPTPPPYNHAIVDSGIDQRSIPMPPPLQLPMLPNFTMDPVGSYYSIAGVSSSSLSPVIPPITAGTGNDMLQMNSALFGNMMAVPPPMPFSHQLGIGTASASTFMAAPQSEASSILSQKDVGMSLHQTNAMDISSMVSATLESMGTMDMDGFWKY